MADIIPLLFGMGINNSGISLMIRELVRVMRVRLRWVLNIYFSFCFN